MRHERGPSVSRLGEGVFFRKLNALAYIVSKVEPCGPDGSATSTYGRRLLPRILLANRSHCGCKYIVSTNMTFPHGSHNAIYSKRHLTGL